MPVVKKTYAELLANYEAALGAVGALGVRYEGTRFNAYRKILDEATRWQLPKRFTAAEEQQRLLFVEATAQAEQLIGASQIWGKLAQPLLVSMLERIIKGPALPPVDSQDDQPRNTLLELSTVRYLKHVGFDVEITGGQEDALASAAGYEFAVECKRPASARRLRRNLNRLSEQLRARRDPSKPRFGYAVVGWDRIADLAGGTGIFQTFKDLEAEVFKVQEDASKIITSIAQQNGLADLAVLGAVIVTAPVYVAEGDGLTLAVEQVAVLALNQREETKAVREAISALYKAAPPP